MAFIFIDISCNPFILWCFCRVRGTGTLVRRGSEEPVPMIPPINQMLQQAQCLLQHFIFQQIATLVQI